MYMVVDTYLSFPALRPSNRFFAHRSGSSPTIQLIFLASPPLTSFPPCPQTLDYVLLQPSRRSRYRHTVGKHDHRTSNNLASTKAKGSGSTLAGSDGDILFAAFGFMVMSGSVFG
nr:hypothetical protein CFP56_60205 [Quercus suber]